MRMPARDIDMRLQGLVDRQVAKKQIRNIVLGIQSADGRTDASAAAGHARYCRFRFRQV